MFGFYDSLGGSGTKETAESLRRRNIRLVCHVAPCHRLPSIFEHGGLLSYNERKAKGIPEDDAPHYWGREGRKEAFGDYVIITYKQEEERLLGRYPLGGTS